MPDKWVIEPVGLPLIRRTCHVCGSQTFRTSGKFRVNANHKLLDVWLLALCTGCGETTKLTVMERINVRSIRTEVLERMHDNDAGLAAELLQDPGVRHRNRVALDWDWRLDTGESASDQSRREAVDVSVRFAAQIPVRPVRLIAEGCGMSRSEVDRLIADGKIVSTAKLSGKVSSDFAFTLKR